MDNVLCCLYWSHWSLSRCVKLCNEVIEAVMYSKSFSFVNIFIDVYIEMCIGREFFSQGRLVEPFSYTSGVYTLTQYSLHQRCVHAHSIFTTPAVCARSLNIHYTSGVYTLTQYSLHQRCVHAHSIFTIPAVCTRSLNIHYTSGVYTLTQYVFLCRLTQKWSLFWLLQCDLNDSSLLLRFFAYVSRAQHILVFEINPL